MTAAGRAVVGRLARLRARRVPGSRPRRHRCGTLGPRRGPDRLGQDGRGGVRGRPRLDRGEQGVLHHPAQSLVQPEVRRSRAPLRHRTGWAPHGGQLHQRRRARRGDDHRSAAQHDLRPFRCAHRAALRGPRRGPLPRERLAGPGVGGGHHPHARPRWTWCACRPPCPTPRSSPTGSRRCAGRPRPSSRSAGPSSSPISTWSGDKARDELLLLPDLRRRPARTRTPPPSTRRSARGPGRGAASGRGSSPLVGRRWWSCWPSEDMLPGDLLHLQPGRVRRGGARPAGAQGCV